MSKYNMIDDSDSFYTDEPIKQRSLDIVYAKTDAENRITDINSSAFLSGTDGWTEIDSGYGVKYHHAQGNYLPKPVMDERGIYRYKLVDGKPVERTQDEIDADYVLPEEKPTTEQRVDALETTTDDIILMMAELIGGN